MKAKQSVPIKRKAAEADDVALSVEEQDPEEGIVAKRRKLLPIRRAAPRKRRAIEIEDDLPPLPEPILCVENGVFTDPWEGHKCLGFVQLNPSGEQTGLIKGQVTEGWAKGATVILMKKSSVPAGHYNKTFLDGRRCWWQHSEKGKRHGGYLCRGLKGHVEIRHCENGLDTSFRYTTESDKEALAIVKAWEAGFVKHGGKIVRSLDSPFENAYEIDFDALLTKNCARLSGDVDFVLKNVSKQSLVSTIQYFQRIQFQTSC